MYATDFLYDGVRLSDYGYMICYFDGSDDNQISNGAEITFSEVPIHHGIKRVVAGTSYDTVITATFYICKDFCNYINDDIYLSTDDIRELARWLGRKKYLPFTLLAEGYDDITYFGTFNITQIRFGTKVVGLQLDMTTNSPFGWQEERYYKFDDTTSFTIKDVSDEIGSLYVTMNLKCRQDGDLIINNSSYADHSVLDAVINNERYQLLDGSSTAYISTKVYDNYYPTIIKNCQSGEIINISHPLISTSFRSHDIQNDFNYEYPRVINTFEENTNTFSFSIPCDVELTYRPLAKIGV